MNASLRDTANPKENPMAPINFDVIENLFRSAYSGGRSVLLEHECYQLLAETGAEAAPDHILIPADAHPTPGDL